MVEINSHMEHTGTQATRDIALVDQPMSGTVIPDSGTGFKTTYQVTSLEIVPYASIQS